MFFSALSGARISLYEIEGLHMGRIFVHPHATRHGLTEGEVKCAWCNFVISQPRQSPREHQIVRIGFAKGVPTPIQMIGVEQGGNVLVYHAMTPPQRSVLNELGKNGGLI